MKERPKIRVLVNRSVEAIDFDAWADRLILALIAADRAAQRQQEAA